MTQQYLLNETPSDGWIPFAGLNKIAFICLGSTTDSYFQYAIELYQQFLDVSGQKGQLFIAHTESETSRIIKSTYSGNGIVLIPTKAQWQREIVPRLIEELAEANYKTFEAILKCGDHTKLESPIIIWPAPLVSGISI